MTALPPEAIHTSPAQINAEIRYSGYYVFKRLPGPLTPGGGPVFAATLESLAASGVTLRGVYDLAGMRAGADLLIWLLAPRLEMLQEAYRAIRRTDLGQGLELHWSATGLHRPAEFNKRHVPAAYATDQTKPWMTVYPFVRSYDWYLLPEAERSAILREHGQMGHEYPDVLATTLNAFSLGDYEWLVTLEASEPHELVDVMRHLRGAKARLYVRLDTPFFTGRRIEPDQAAGVLA